MLPLLSRQRIFFWSAIAALVFTNALFQIRLAHDDSQTNDEAAHLVSGYSYWTTGDWRLNPEHPPLSKLAAALPLLGMASNSIRTRKPEPMPMNSRSAVNSCIEIFARRMTSSFGPGSSPFASRRRSSS